MDYAYFGLIGKLLFSLTIVLGLMYITFKLASTKVDEINKNKYIKVLERTQISKESSILVVKIGDKGYIMSTSQGKTEKLDEISSEELLKIETIKKSEIEKVQNTYDNIYVFCKKKLKKIVSRFNLKEESYEK